MNEKDRTRDEAFELFVRIPRGENKRCLEQAYKVESVPVYSCDGFMNFFYGLMTPSTGYIMHLSFVSIEMVYCFVFLQQTAPDQIPEYRDDKNFILHLVRPKMGRINGDIICWRTE